MFVPLPATSYFLLLKTEHFGYYSVETLEILFLPFYCLFRDFSDQTFLTYFWSHVASEISVPFSLVVS